jgi:hypothetical protein
MIYLPNSPLFKLMFIIVALYLGFYINFESEKLLSGALY